ncbi:complement C5 [Brachyhypopomus gauderio]|uniref:complement C5 n=1 Tax=Brachyhypopomus gauderio TaxID=698409 RepID=UPI0040426B79
MGLLVLLCLIHVACWTQAQRQTFLITAPKVLRVDATETVVVQLFGYDTETPVQLYLKDTNAPGGRTYSSQSVTLNAQNDYQAAATLRILQEIRKEDTHVYLIAVSTSWSKFLKIPITRDNGFLFVQTDKPLYTPEQKVEVRVYSFTEELRKSSRPVSLTFMDPDGAKVEIIELKDFSGVKPLLPPFKIPLKPKFGVWKIEAAYSYNFSTTATAEFEVKEYVLPSIAVRIQPEKNYVSIRNFEAFKLKIFAKYVHGGPVTSADVFLKFGYASKDETVIIPTTLRRYEMDNGELEVVLNIKRVLSKIQSGPLDLTDMINHYLRVVILLQESTGGISQDAILSNVKFVNSPFSLHLLATPPYIKPSLPYNIRVLVKDPLGVPVKGVPVKVQATLTKTDQEMEPLKFFGHQLEYTALSRDDGVAYFVCNIPDYAQKADFTFETSDQKYPPESQARLMLNTVTYKSNHRRYLYIDLPSESSSFDVNNYASINIYFHYHDYLPLKSFSYQIISKGRVVKFTTVQRVNDKVQNINFKVTSDMVPSARLLVYYIISGEEGTELVADSVWFDVKGKCVNGLEMKLTSPESEYKPKDKIQLSLTAKSESARPLVALSAVDTALYDLRANDRDPLNKVLRHFEQKDLGCGGGGGQNNVDVFERAGIHFLTNADVQTTFTDETSVAAVRPKRSTISLNDKFEEKDNRQFLCPAANEYKEYKTCCLTGTDSNPTLETCNERTKRLDVPDMVCKRVFNQCCKYAQKLRQENEKMVILTRSENFYLDSKTPEVRSYFPESWLWEEHEMDKSGSLSLIKALPDSLTTWEMKAVGVFGNGICVAEPLKVSVSQDVSVNVPLPYSMVRGEQIELKGSVYNQRDTQTTFHVTLTASDGVCVFHGQSNVNKGKVAGRSVAMVRFLIMALEAGNHKLSFTLTTAWEHETVVKTLRVVPEGIRKEVLVGGRLDPQGVYGQSKSRLELRNALPLHLVPKSPVERLLTVNGEVLGELQSIITKAAGMSQLTNLPRGSAEVELMGLLPVFYVYDYLDQTQQWGLQGEALSESDLRRKMNEGVTSVMSFKSKQEHSFCVWKNKEPSTWLTALVVKTLAKVDRYVRVDRDMLSNTVRWLLTKHQNPDGSFTEESSYRPSKLMGAGADVTEQTVFLTSFVVIGISHALDVPKSNLQTYKNGMENAAQYLSSQVRQVKSLYVRAIAAYALLLVDPHSQSAVTVHEQLKREAQVKENPVIVRFWEEKDAPQNPLTPNRASAKSVETTVYILLSTLLRGDMTYAKPILNWLTQDQRYGGGFHSTQDTILTLEALTKYRITAQSAFLQMQVDVSYRKKGDIADIYLSQKNPVGKPIEIAHAEDIILKTGFSSGVSFATLKTVYYETADSNDNCHFDISIDIFPRDPKSNDPMFRSPRMVACAKYKPRQNEVETEAGHTVMEIDLPTGVMPIQDDLRRYRDGLESYISDFEINGDRLILQIDSIPSEEFYCVGFRVQELFQTGMNSASVFNVYEFHDPDNRCIKFYQPQGRRLHRLCEGDQCQCMAAECCSFKDSSDPSITVEKRMKDVCKDKDNIKYVFKVTVKSTETEGDFLTYYAIVDQVLKKGSEDIVKDSEVGFIKKATCSSTKLEIGKQYLIMGAEIMQLRVQRRYKYKFPLDSQALVEWWPSDADCQIGPCKDHAKVLNDFEFEYLLNGCEGGF